MAIKKQEFYEGAALHLVIRAGGVTSIQYDSPFFLLNEQFLVRLKYCTRGRSPWTFTFSVEEQLILSERAAQFAVIVGLICGADGVVALDYDAYLSVAAPRGAAIHISCCRKYDEHYEVNGPDGTVAKKVAPSNWSKILRRGIYEAS